MAGRGGSVEDVNSLPTTARPTLSHCRLAEKGCNQASGDRYAIFAWFSKTFVAILCGSYATHRQRGEKFVRDPPPARGEEGLASLPHDVSRKPLAFGIP